MDDLYEILQVHPNASPEVISKAYRVLAMRHHPDVAPAERRVAAEAYMKRLNAAFDVLGDAQKRAAYDAQRKAQESAQAAAPAPQRGQGAAATAVVDPGMCVFHRERKRVSVCIECRRSICESCRVLWSGRPYCSECAARISRPQPTAPPPGAPMPPPRAPKNTAWEPLQRLTLWGAGNAALAAATGTLWLFVFLVPALVWNVPAAILAIAASMAAAAFCVCALVIASEGFSKNLSRAARPALSTGLSLFLLASLGIGAGRLGDTGRLMNARFQDTNAATAAWTQFTACFDAKQKSFSEQGGAIIDRYVEGITDPKPSKSSEAPLPPQLKRFVFKSLWRERPNAPSAPANKTTPSPLPASPQAAPVPPEVTQAAAAARTFLGTDYSQREAHRQQRAVCLAFLVWAEGWQAEGPDLTAEAKEYLAIAKRAEAYVEEWEGYCKAYLERPAKQQAAAEAVERKRREEQQRQAADAERIRQEEQRRRAADEERKRVESLCNDKRPEAVPRGLVLMTREFRDRDPEAFENLAHLLGKCARDRKDREQLQQVVSQYGNFSTIRRYTLVFESWLKELNPAAGVPPANAPKGR